MRNATVFTIAWAGLAFTQAAGAAEIRPMAAASIDLPAMGGVAYYTQEPEGYRVVATMTHGASGATIRFVSILSEGESLLLSVPRAIGEPAESVEIVRIDDRVHVRPAVERLEAKLN